MRFSWHLCTYHISTSRVAASRFFLRILNPRKWCFPGNWNVRLNQKLYHECFRPYNQSCQVVFELFSILIPKNQYFAEEISIFPRGNNMTKKNTFLPHMPAADLAFFQGGASSTSRVAASRFFFAILNPRKWCFPGIYAHITYPRAA